jgi:hypothetical protein
MAEKSNEIPSARALIESLGLPHWRLGLQQ